LRIISRQKYLHKKHPSARRSSLSPSRNSDQPFSLRIHRNLHPILDRIRIPRPQPFTPDPFQVEALEVLERADVLVTAPTGSGKTYIAIKAIERILQHGGKSWYASPLKALSNSKYEEFSQMFGSHNVGILTGDRKENLQAPIIVGTTEILRNQLYDTMHRGEDVEEDLVVLDEAHFLGDEDRGVVWEEVLIYLPSRVRLLLLSATIQNAQEICSWLEWIRSTHCTWVAAYDRPVPLYPLFLFPHGELSPLSTRRGLSAKVRTVDSKSFPKNDFPNIPRVLQTLRQANLLPAIFFLKSRADCERAIFLCHPVPDSHGGPTSASFRERLNELLESSPFLRRHQHLSILKYARVGAHHGGQLPHWKLFLERLMQEGFLEAIFSTSTVAAGVNYPARTVVICQSDRFNGRDFVELSATDLLQMTGRAGRRGMDEIGFVLVLPGPYQDPQLVHDLLKSPPDPITSQIRVNFSMALNLLLSHRPDEIYTLFSSSLATYQNLKRESQVSEEFLATGKTLDQWMPQTSCGSLEQLEEIRPQYGLLKERTRKAWKLWKRQAALHSFYDLLVLGRIFLSGRGTPYAVVSPPQMEQQTVDAVRLALPMRFRKGRIRTYKVAFQRIRSLGEKLASVPSAKDREGWETLVSQVAAKIHHPGKEESGAEKWLPLEIAAQELTGLVATKSALPCDSCSLFGPCQKSTSHPFSSAVQHYFEHRSQMNTIQEQLWRSFLQHYRILEEEGYVNQDGRLTEDGLWASKLRLDQPLLISEGIRKEVFPADNPELLAALIAPFVMDRERPGDFQLSNLVWKYPEVAKPFFRMLKNLQRLRERLQAEGFSLPTMPFWAVVTLHYWALGESWEKVREISGMDEGDLAMVILRTADHLRQIESLAETHPRLAESARGAIEKILREPVLIE
jgi:ATP-dependent RNA helicase HelY